MAQTPTKPLTLETFLQLPETKPASEYLDGRISQKPMPKGRHSALQTELAALINAAVKPAKVARALTELRCTFGGSSMVPDIAVVTWQRIHRNEQGEIADTFSITPDWTIEILSPRQGTTKVTKKILRCLKHGTEMGWLIDARDRSVFVYHDRQEIEVLDEPDAVLPMPSFASELSITVESLFSILLM